MSKKKSSAGDEKQKRRPFPTLFAKGIVDGENAAEVVT